MQALENASLPAAWAAASTDPPAHTWLAASATACAVAVLAALMAVAEVCTMTVTVSWMPWSTALEAAAALPLDREAGSTVPPEPCREAARQGWRQEGQRQKGSLCVAGRMHRLPLCMARGAEMHIRQGCAGGRQRRVPETWRQPQR